MSITLRKIARQVIKLESGGDRMRDSPLSEAYVILHARQGLAKLVKPLFYESMAEGDRTPPKMFWIPYKVDLTVDPDTERKCFIIPDFYIHLPNNAGIRVAPVDDPLNEFIPRHNPAVSFNLPCGEVQGNYSYWTEGYMGYVDDNIELGKLLLKLLCPAPDSIDEDDPLPIYPEQQDDLVRLTREIIRGQPIQDKIADGNKDIGVNVAR